MKTWTKSDAWDVMLQIMRIVGAFEFLMSFLYLHYIGFPEKHQAGLRVGVMQYALLSVVSLYRVVLEPTSAKNKATLLTLEMRLGTTTAMRGTMLEVLHFLIGVNHTLTWNGQMLPSIALLKLANC